jgi:hypothetical protein
VKGTKNPRQSGEWVCIFTRQSQNLLTFGELASGYPHPCTIPGSDGPGLVSVSTDQLTLLIFTVVHCRLMHSSVVSVPAAALRVFIPPCAAGVRIKERDNHQNIREKGVNELI